MTRTSLTFAQAFYQALLQPRQSHDHRRPKQRLLGQVLHDNQFGGTYVTTAGNERMEARVAAYALASFELNDLSITQQKRIGFISKKPHTAGGYAR